MSSIRGAVRLYIHAVNTQWQHGMEAEAPVPCEGMATRYCPLARVCMHLCVTVMHLFRQFIINLYYVIYTIAESFTIHKTLVPLLLKKLHSVLFGFVSSSMCDFYNLRF